MSAGGDSDLADPHGLASRARAEGFAFGIVWSILVALVFLGALESLQRFIAGDAADAWLLLGLAAAGTAVAVKIARNCLNS